MKKKTWKTNEKTIIFEKKNIFEKQVYHLVDINILKEVWVDQN